MQLRADAVSAHLARGKLAPIYTVCAEEPLLAIEAQDAIRLAARRLGHSERTVLQMDARADWSQLHGACQSMSLFADKRIVEVRLPSGKPGKEGAAALTDLAKTPAEGVLLLIALPKLERASRDSAWATALTQAGVWVDAAAVDRAQLPTWLAARLARQEQHCEAAALAFLADRVEGNLLAAHQEIMKLGLLYPPGALSLDAVADSVLHLARYDVFGLPLAMLGGDVGRVHRTVAGLRAEGEALPLIVWSVSEELRGLLRVGAAMAEGKPFQVAAREQRLWGPRAALAERAMPQLDAEFLMDLLSRCADLDRLSKGLRVVTRDSDPWLELADIGMRLAKRCTTVRAARTHSTQSGVTA